MSVRIINYIIFLTLSCHVPLHAQWHQLEAGMQLGGAVYAGDITERDPTMFTETRPAYGLFVRYRAFPFLHIKAAGYAVELAGDDLNYAGRTFRLDRAFHFDTKILEADLLLEWHPLAHTSFDPIIKPYLGTGIVYGRHEAVPNFERTKLIRTLGKEIFLDQEQGGDGTFIAIPINFGIQYKVNSRLQIEFEGSIRATNTDFLDGVSNSGNPENNDWYGLLQFGLSYQIGTDDRDRDGIVDKIDECPDLAGSSTAFGCPDTDRDGIMDHLDRCPDAYGKKSLGGCPDTDSDGVADKDDLCPDLPGLRTRRGCPILDTDGDGIEDTKDKCPMIAGEIANLGCPDVDSDQDGITDVKDKCPYEFGLAILDGCPDTDGDGIEDRLDKCPQIFGVLEAEGCPLDQAPTAEVERIGQLTVQFDRDSEKLSLKAYQELNELVRFLDSYPEYKVELIGYTSLDEGSKAGRRSLGEARAKASYRYLLSENIPANRINYLSRGLDQTGKYQNKTKHRRVEFRLYKAGL